MAKRSKRRTVRLEKDHAGCIWGLISIFDFRYGRSTKRLLSDRRRGIRHVDGYTYNSTKLKMLTNSNDKSQRIEDDKKNETPTTDVVKASVKELMEEEMFSEQVSKKHVKSAQVEPEQGGPLRKNSKRTYKTRAKSCDMNFFHSDLEKKTSDNIDLEVILKELCQIHQKSRDLDMQSDQEFSLVEENLGAAIEEFMNQRFTNGENGKIQHSKELMDALRTLSSNKELFLKLVQDPNLLSLKHIQSLEEEPSKSKTEEQINNKNRSFFRRRRSRSQETNAFSENEKCEPSSRIVILKPGPALQSQSHDDTESKVQCEKNDSQFSFTKIRKKLKHAMGKDHHMISHNVLEHQNMVDNEKRVGDEIGGWSSPNRNHFYTEKFTKSSIIKRGEKIGKPKEGETISSRGVSNIYIEAKKHLSEMLSSGDEKDLMSSRLPKTLGRILSLPEYNFSPSCSPGNGGDNGFVTAQMRLSPRSNIHMINENTWRLVQENRTVHLSPLRKESDRGSCIIDNNTNDKVQSPKTNPNVSDELNEDNLVEENVLSMRDEMSSQGVVKIVDSEETRCQQGSEVLDISCEPSSSLIARDVEICNAADVCDEERYPDCLKMDSHEEDRSFSSPLVSPSSSSVATKIGDPENVIDRYERPSPVSVLDPVFTEDDVSPASIKSRPAETSIQPLQLCFEPRSCSASGQSICIQNCMEDEESAFEYVEAVLLASDVNWDEYLMRWFSSEQILDKSLFDEVELFSSRSCHDQKLLFDCTNDVLTEVCERYLGCSFVKNNVRRVPKGMSLIHEVWQGVEWNLLQQPSPHSLDQLVRRDLEKSGTWMNLRLETENIVFEVGNSILEKLMEDSILSFANYDSVGDEFSAKLGEMSRDEASVNS